MIKNNQANAITAEKQTLFKNAPQDGTMGQ